MHGNDNIAAQLAELSNELDLNEKSISIILAAGHGKRIKSETSKMLHKVWGVPTVLRVAKAANEGLQVTNQIIVVGIKALDVARASGVQKHRVFAWQAEQHGTGHAVKVALELLDGQDYDGTIYIFPGDVGLLSKDVVATFREAFDENPSDMMVLTSYFRGDSSENYYGRILRVPEKDADGAPAGEDQGKVIAIMEHKDILSLPENEPYLTRFNGRTYAFTRQELLDLREFNTGVYAFRAQPLLEKIHSLSEDNAQGELYITDLIAIFNDSGLTVRASATEDEHAVLGFNVKSVLKQMEDIYRQSVYDRLKDIITITDKDDFFIADEVVERILEMDEKDGPLDIVIGKGVFIGPNVELSKGVQIGNNAQLEGNIVLGENVIIHQNVNMSTYHDQVMRIGARTEIFKGDIIKGDLVIGEDCRIESGVNITGAYEYPVRIGNNVLIKGTSRVFGCIIDDDIFIEHSVLKFQYVEKTIRKDGTVQPIRWVIPPPQGLDSVHPIEPGITDRLV